jgi:nitrogen fixation NifU-like protein
MNDLYQEVILEEYRNPQNFGVMENPDLVLHERNSSCGDEVTIYLKLNKKKDQVTDIKWQGQGCAISMASTSFTSHLTKNASLKKIETFSQKTLEELMGIDDIAIGREKCLLLGLQAIKKALNL